jgi:enamine deaminase RidA (YjgF/YER057c/UK114 family)
MNLEQRLEALGIVLPPAPRPIGNYVPGVVAGGLLFMSGVGPRHPDGTSITGKLGVDLDVEQGRAAARLVAINMLANIRAVLGSLERVDRVVKTLGMVNCAPDFGLQPKVIDGFSNVFVELFGEERGRDGNIPVLGWIFDRDFPDNKIAAHPLTEESPVFFQIKKNPGSNRTEPG